MNDWLPKLIDWTSHQDYGWFLAGLMWCAVLVGAWGRGPRREGREGWLIWLAGAGFVESAIELALYANNYHAPYFGWDFALGLVQALGIAALWWPLAGQLTPSRPQLWRALTVIAAVYFGVARMNAPVPGGLAVALAAVGGAWVVVRSAAAVRVLGGLPPHELRRMKAGLLIVALLPVVATFGPLAYALGDGRRWVDFSPFELPSAVAHILAAGLLGTALWAQRLRAAPDASESAAQRWRADLRLGFTILVVWLVLGLALAVANGRQARHAFEQNLLLRARTAAALLDQDALRVALGPQLKLGEMRMGRLHNGRQVAGVRIQWALSPSFEILRRQLQHLHAANNDVVYIYFATIRDGKIIVLVADDDRPKQLAWRVIYRDATAADEAILAQKTAFFEGPFRNEWGAQFSSVAPVVDTASSQPFGWLTMTVPATLWATSFATARLQSMAVTMIGVAMWVLAVIYRLRRTERELALQRAEHSAAADRAKSEFLAQVSHEMRAPLQGIFGYTDLLEMTLLNSHQQDLLTSLRGQSGLMLRLANDLVDLGALQAGAFRLNPETVELHALVNECVDSVRPRAEAKGLQVFCTLHPGVPGLVRSDGARLRQVLLNLLGNAVKYTREGSVKLMVQRCESLAMDAEVPVWARFGAWVEFAIIDTGPGVALEDQQRIFQPFVRLERDVAEQGTGLGLALTGRLCQAMGGSVHVESDGEHGSSFIVRLPLGSPDEPASGTRNAVEPAKVAWPGLRVLVADDNTLVREMLVTFLRGHGAQVTEAKDGLEAVEECRERMFDVILLDVSMPWLNGHAAAQRLRAPGGARGKPWIIGLSADARPEESARAKAEGMDCFLVKPMALAMLAEAISAAPAAHRVWLTAGADTAECDGPLRERLLEIYVRETPRVVDGLRGAARAHDWMALSSLAHYLKNSADTLGAGRLQRYCRELQFAAEAADDGRVAPLLAAVESASTEPINLGRDRRLVHA
ncbi:MAG TPA: ATP-binding protein [Opitutaceae bacterium]|jgi:signal transduction histidine kinase/FixJ family two-component response regulator|nr:ATP-binding protein [Opitutaceae bacterium]